MAQVKMKSELELLISFFSALSLIENILAHCLNSLLLQSKIRQLKKKQVVFYYSLLIIVYCAFERKLSSL